MKSLSPTSKRTGHKIADPAGPLTRIRLHRRPFLQVSLQLLDAALEILDFSGRATIPRPLGLLLWANGSHIMLKFRRSPLFQKLEKLHPVHRLLHLLG